MVQKSKSKTHTHTHTHITFKCRNKNEMDKGLLLSMMTSHIPILTKQPYITYPPYTLTNTNLKLENLLPYIVAVNFSSLTIRLFSFVLK